MQCCPKFHRRFACLQRQVQLDEQGKNVPHGLADKLKNVAGDYEIFSEGKKGSFDLYLQQLKDWCESDWSHPCVRAILSYVSKKIRNSRPA